MPVSREKTEFEQKAADAYNRDFAPAIIGYVAVTVAITIFVDFEGAGAWKYLVALLPIIPALWGVRAVGRNLARIDEMARTDLLTAMAIGFGLAMIAALTIGFLGIAGLDSTLWGPWVIYGAGMAGWAFGAARSRVNNG